MKRLVGPSPERVAPYAIMQKWTFGCWAAAISSVLKSYGIRIDQLMIRDYLRALGVRRPNSSGTPSDITYFLNRGYFDSAGYHYVLSSEMRLGMPSVTDLKIYITNGKPAVFWTQAPGAKFGHVVVCTSLCYDDAPENNVIGLVLLDPSKSTPQVVSWPQIMNSIRYVWLVKNVIKSPAPVPLRLRKQTVT